MTWTEQVDARIAIVQEQLNAARELAKAAGFVNVDAYSLPYLRLLMDLQDERWLARELDKQCSNSPPKPLDTVET